MNFSKMKKCDIIFTTIEWKMNMETKNNLVVMLTYDDKTILNAKEIFEQCRNSKALYWGFKEKPLPLDQMKELFQIMKDCHKKTVLEVVAYSEAECLQGAHMAHECGVDMLMGTLYFDSVNSYCKQHQILYMPFVGQVSQCPSILEGNLEEMVAQANSYLEKGVYGIDLLGYRYQGDANTLIHEFVKQVHAPVCVAGSINSMERLALIKDTSPFAFTIGSAFFDHDFGESVCDQIDMVCTYMQEDISC